MTARRAYRDEDWPDYGPRPEPLDSLPLFAPVEVRTMARRGNPDTSKAAAMAVADKLNALQARVYEAFVTHGSLTGKELEALPELVDLGFSTARKRVTELASRGLVVWTKVVRGGCREYAVAAKGEK